MSICKIEENLQAVLNNFKPKTFIYDFIGACGKPKSTLARLQKGDLNHSKVKGEVLWKDNLFFKEVKNEELSERFDQVIQCKQIKKRSPRFLIVTDYNNILAFDTKTFDKINIPFENLVEHFDFFHPLLGREKLSHHKENEADIKAAERMAKIYDEICINNLSMRLEDAEALNIFLSRLLFCFFAESTQIFEKNIFTETIQKRTLEDGSDLHQFLNELFEVLNKEKTKRSKYPKKFEVFPYVNGGLFKEKYKIPKFTPKLRRMIIECGNMDWSAINPDIFGSMIQTVIHPDQRSSLGVHYTSVTNIMKLIQPLFLDDLYQEFEKNKMNTSKLEKLYKRLACIKIFDPACGSGNFLIIAYKELRKFEMRLLKRLEEMGQHPTFLSQIQLSAFYGIELDGFASEIAKLSLWLAEHQMNIEFKNIFGKMASSLPLKKGGKIICGNATRENWEEVCPKDHNSEIYIIGNPPYLGARNQDGHQKQDIAHVLSSIPGNNNLDYIACWFFKGAQYIQNSNAECAFVSTNSIFQGSQVPILWPYILNEGIEIGFAYRSFKWTNNAKKKAAVICGIVGLRNTTDKPKYIYQNNLRILSKNINAYLLDAGNIFINSRKNPLSNLPSMSFGSMPNDGGHLIFNLNEYKKLITSDQTSKKFFKIAIGAKEYLNGIKRYCLWIKDNDLEEALKITVIRDRLENVKKHRSRSKRSSTKVLSKFPHKFGEIRHADGISIVVPRVSSEKREYIPYGYANSKSVILDSAQALYNVESYIFGVISSRMHMTWIKTVAGRLKMDYRYSSTICYNTFPLPAITKKSKKDIEIYVLKVLNEREKHSDKTLAMLYDPKKMPVELLIAHQNLDAAIDRCYRSKPFENDEERLECLFKLYEEMIQKEQKRNKHA